LPRKILLSMNREAPGELSLIRAYGKQFTQDRIAK
jgi:hypothetical protein